MDKAFAALELYFKRMELAELGKVPVPQNSDMPSSDNEEIVGLSRIRKQKEAFSPSSNLRRSKRTVSVPNSPVLSVKKSKSTMSSSTAPITRDADVGKSWPNISNPIPPPNLDVMAPPGKCNFLRI